MLDLILITLFVLSSTLVVYHHVGYPLILRWYSANNPLKPIRYRVRGYRKALSDKRCASITIVVPAHNEQEWIAEKIRNIACLDYPRSKLKVVIACDGCSDETVSVAQQTIQEAICCDTHFEIICNENNIGKLATINQQLGRIESDITALSDVSCLLSIDCLWIANQHFKNRRVGVLHGSYQLLTDGDSGEHKYWQYQNRVIASEASIGAVLGAHGAFYLFRTKLFPTLAANTINDDFVIPMEIVRAGYKAAYDERLTAIELEATSEKNDYKRRLRISAGNMQQLVLLASMLLPQYGSIAFAFFSGKGLRVVTPYLLLTALVTSVALSHHALFNAILILQVALYCLALLTQLFPHLFSYKLCKLIRYIVAGHTANLIGGLRYLFGMEMKPWTRINQ